LFVVVFSITTNGYAYEKLPIAGAFHYQTKAGQNA